MALVLALGVPAAAPDQRAPPAAQRTSRMTSLLDSYAEGDYKTVDAELRRAFPFGAASRLAIFSQVLETEAPEWIRRGPRDEQDRRRLVVAAVSLEAANHGGLEDWPTGRALVEWACALVRKNSRAIEAERTWHWGAIAIFEGAADGATLQVHVSHALKRFPGDHRFLLARGVGTELRTWPDPRNGKTPRERDAGAVELTVTRLTEALGFEEVRAEAAVRLGYLALRNGDADAALRYLRDGAMAKADPFVRYLSHLFEGRALEQLNRPLEAVAAYRAAIAAEPGQTAQLALGAALARTGQRQEATATVAAAVVATPARVDPWTIYGRGDARLWPEISERLRKELQ
jgi:tetratricopeptide (TPR) repeat protein